MIILCTNNSSNSPNKDTREEIIIIIRMRDFIVSYKY